MLLQEVRDHFLTRILAASWHSSSKLGSAHLTCTKFPLQQGLRHVAILEETAYKVRDHLPLQQGLRQSSSVRVLSHLPHVRDHFPLQQGLRLLYFDKFDCMRQRPSSITTRIKTVLFKTSSVVRSETILHYNKD